MRFSKTLFTLSAAAALTLGATGKMQKNKLRDQFRDYKLPSA